MDALVMGGRQPRFTRNCSTWRAERHEKRGKEDDLQAMLLVVSTGEICREEMVGRGRCVVCKRVSEVNAQVVKFGLVHFQRAIGIGGQ